MCEIEYSREDLERIEGVLRENSKNVLYRNWFFMELWLFLNEGEDEELYRVRLITKPGKLWVGLIQVRAHVTVNGLKRKVYCNVNRVRILLKSTREMRRMIVSC